MLKKILAVLAMLYAVTAFAAVDVNKATAAELDALKGIGPVTSKRILDERKKGEFKSWDDFMSRVKGITEGKATSYSAQGLTVQGEAFKKASKKAAKADKKDAKAPAGDGKKDAKAEKKDDKTAAAAKPAASAKK